MNGFYRRSASPAGKASLRSVMISRQVSASYAQTPQQATSGQAQHRRESDARQCAREGRRRERTAVAMFVSGQAGLLTSSQRTALREPESLGSQQGSPCARPSPSGQGENAELVKSNAGGGSGPASRRTQACGQAPKRVCVLGAGVIGLSTALRISQTFADQNVEVCIVADKMGEETTSDGAGGLWEPYKLGNTSPELINDWGSETFSYLKGLHHSVQGLYHSAEAAQAGVTEVAAYQLWRQPTPDPPWRDVVPHFHRLSESELQPFRPAAEPASIAEGWCFTTMINEQRVYLLWLTTLVLKAGIRMHRRTIHSLQEFVEWDAVVNCSGLGALRLFRDKEMFTMRGHVIRVKAPWIKANYFIDEQNYIIPNVNNVVLGGTAQLNDLDLWPRDEDRQAILDGCTRLMPSLASAKVIGEWVGLRPCRSSVRLEAEQLHLEDEEHEEKDVVVIHNYGHGGAGVTLHWGCAASAVRLLEDCL